MEKYCQSCGMPMREESLYGTNQDKSKNQEYCTYCFQDGEFTAPISMEEMIEVCVPHMTEANENMTEEEARKMMQSFFPTLKRWQSK